MHNDGYNGFDYPYKALSPVDNKRKQFRSIEDVYEELMNCYQELEEKNVDNKAEAIYSEHLFFCNTAELLDEDIQLTIKEYNYCKTFNTPPFQSLDKTPANIVDDFLRIEYIMKQRKKTYGDK